MKPSRGVSLVLRGLLDLDPSSMYIHMAEHKGVLCPPAQDCPGAGTGVCQGDLPCCLSWWQPQCPPPPLLSSRSILSPRQKPERSVHLEPPSCLGQTPAGSFQESPQALRDGCPAPRGRHPLMR